MNNQLHYAQDFQDISDLLFPKFPLYRMNILQITYHP